MFNTLKLLFIGNIALIHLYASGNESLLFHGNCTTCHYETQTISAPSVVEFKRVYREAFTKKEDFVEHMAKWVQYPDPKTALMPKAIKKHGLMPELGFDLETLKSISSYIYDTNFTKSHEGHSN